MKKIIWLLILIILCLGAIVAYLAFGPVKAFADKSVLAPVAGVAGGTVKAIYANPLWKAYFANPASAFLWGLGIMGVFAFVWWKFAAPKMPTIRKPSVPAGTSMGSTGIRATTPVGATLRPETTVLPSAPLVEEIPEETVETTK